MANVKHRIELDIEDVGRLIKEALGLSEEIDAKVHVNAGKVTIEWEQKVALNGPYRDIGLYARGTK